jgi:hypothetical protein
MGTKKFENAHTMQHATETQKNAETPKNHTQDANRVSEYPEHNRVIVLARSRLYAPPTIL